MNVKELRIGNILFIPGLERCVKVSAMFKTHFRCEDKDGVAYDESLRINYQPIPLTAEILEKAGFKFDISTGTHFLNMVSNYLELLPASGYWWPTYASFPELSCESEQRVAVCRIQHVHQLQNLIYALLGQELEIEL